MVIPWNSSVLPIKLVITQGAEELFVTLIVVNINS